MRASAVASGFVLVFRTLIHLGLRYVLFVLGLGLSLRQEHNGPEVKIILMKYLREILAYNSKFRVQFMID